jgi:hypothetical protein
MKLIQQKIRKIERARAVGSSRPRPVGTAWTSDNVRIDPGHELAEGEHIATDVHVIEPAQGELPPRWRVVERITTDLEDNGRLYDAEGREIGTAQRVAGHMIKVAEYETGDAQA